MVEAGGSSAMKDVVTAPTAPPTETRHEAPGAARVLTLSTIAFTLMFAVWLMFGILGVPIQREFGLSNTQLAWITSLAVLNGSMWRLPAGMIADRIGGRKVMLFLLLAGAVAAVAVSFATSYPMLLALAFLVGLVGNGFSAGVSWNSAWFSDRRKGFALGVFGAGNVGASITKFIGPAIIAATAGATYFGVVQGGWRLIPVVYAVLLVLTAIAVFVLTPRADRMPGATRTMGQQLEPLKDVRVWRFSLYYVVVFGAYVALSAYLPSYYVKNFGVSLTTAGLLAATFIFPASLLRPLGGWVSDTWGARRAMYVTFIVMLLTSGALMMPDGYIVLTPPSGAEVQTMRYAMSLPLFVALVFLLGCAMGIGKAAVYKHIPTYFPDNVGSVGGLVGMLGGLGGFFLPLMFSYTQTATGLWSTAFAILFAFTAVSLLWMHVTIVRMHKRESAHLAEFIDEPAPDTATTDAH